jgi:hypothetical protein
MTFYKYIPPRYVKKGGHMLVGHSDSDFSLIKTPNTQVNFSLIIFIFIEIARRRKSKSKSTKKHHHQANLPYVKLPFLLLIR